MASEKSSVRHRIYSLYPLFFISLVVVAIGIQMLSGPGTQFDELDSRTADLEKVNIALTNQVESLQEEIRSLSAQLKSLTFSNESSNQLADLYKHIANSVVLIENRIMYRVSWYKVSVRALYTVLMDTLSPITTSSQVQANWL